MVCHGMLYLISKASCRLTGSMDAAQYSTESPAGPFFPEKMSPVKVLTMKDYENQITALKKENFNLKLRIYFMEERMQQKCDDSTEDIFKTNIELKVELESMKREMAEKQELLISASKALESLAGRDSREPHHVREQAQREMDSLRDAFNKKIADLEQALQGAELEINRMASIAEQEKCKNIDMEKRLQNLNASAPHTNQINDLQQALGEKDNLIRQLKDNLIEASLKNSPEKTNAPSADQVKQLTDLLSSRELELQALREERNKAPPEPQKTELHRLEFLNQQLTREVTQARNESENLTKTLADIKNENMVLTKTLEEKENDLNSEKKNALKRDKTIQGLTQILREKENEIAELCHEVEDRDEALSKAREAAHKAQLQKYQGAEEHQNLLMEKQTELAQLQGDHHAKTLETQKLQRALDRKEQELSGLQQAKEQLEMELEETQQQKKKGDKALNDLNNKLKKLNGDIKDREGALEQQYQETLSQIKQKVLSHETTIQQLTSSLLNKEQQLQDYLSMIRDLEHGKSSEGVDAMVSTLRQRLKDKDKALEQAVDEKFAALEDKDNEIHTLQLSLREKERDLERLNNLVSNNEETINSLDGLIKEKDVELQNLANTLKNLQRSKQEMEDHLSRSLREKDAIISQLQLSLEGKAKDLEEMTTTMLSHSKSHSQDFSEQMSQRVKVAEAMLAESVKVREQLIADNESAVEGLLATINSKDLLLKESAEHYKCVLSQRMQELDELRKQLSERQQQMNATERQCSAKTQEALTEATALRGLLEEKDALITKLLQQAKDRDQFTHETRHTEELSRVLELKQTIQIMQEKLEEKDAELCVRFGENKEGNIPSPKKHILLKKELLQTNEALNKALRREAELKLMLNEMEVRCERFSANIESLTATLQTKDEIINTLYHRIGQKPESLAFEDHGSSSRTERLPPKLPQRARTIIGGDDERQTVPSSKYLQQEHEALNRALKAEQQLYSSLVRTVKEQDSVQRLHALQLELTAVQLLRQQLEESIKANEELRDDLEREMHKVKTGEGMNHVDPNELESMRNQLEDAQRWNMSLQFRLGAIQSRGGGVGGASEGDSLMLLGDQTSYMSICVGEEQEECLSQLSSKELVEKVAELQDYISRQLALNRDLQNQLSLLEKSHLKSLSNDDENVASQKRGRQPSTRRDEGSQTDAALEENFCGDPLRKGNSTSSVEQTRGETLYGSSKNKSLCLNDITISSPFEACVDSCPKENEQEEWKDEVSLEKCSDGLGQFGEVPKETTSNDPTKSNKSALQKSNSKGRSRHKDGSKSGVTKVGSSHSRLPVPVRRMPEAAVEESLRDKRFSEWETSSSSSHEPLVPDISTSNVPPTLQPELQQQCQDKDTLIQGLHEKLAELKELQTQLQEKERLNVQYAEALQAAESTIAYLTACSLDNQGAFGSNVGDSNTSLQIKCTELERTLNEKEEYISELTELLHKADNVLNSSKNPCPNDESTGVDIKALLQRNEPMQQEDQPGFSSKLAPNAHWDLNMNSKKTADAVERDGQTEGVDFHINESRNNMMTVLMNCLNTTESAVASLTAHCTNSPCSTDLQTCLDKLKKAFSEKDKLPNIQIDNSKKPSSHQKTDQHPQSPHHNLQVLYEVFCGLQQSISELQALQKSSDAQRQAQNAKALPPNVQNQIETLHKELREKRKACKNLEEKLATAQSIMTNTPSPGAAQKALKRDEKGVQVDLQDLGYETSGKSENDREESSSTDLEVGFKPIIGASSLPSLSKQEQAAFSSTENLYSASSTYPTSPVFSSAKASLKSLRRSSLSSDVVASTFESSVIQEEDHNEPLDEEEGSVKNKAALDKPSLLNISSERRGSLCTSDQLQSGSTSPARLESLIQSQARELSQLRQEIKDSRRLGALQRQQLEDLGQAFSNLIQSAKLDSLMGEEVKKQLDRSIAIMDSLEGRLDRSQRCLEGEHLFGSGPGTSISHRLNKDLQEKNRLIQTLQSPGSRHSSHSDLHLDSSSPHSPESKQTQGRLHSADWAVCGGGGGAPGSDHTLSSLQGLHRQNARLQERLRSSEQLNTTLRSELDLRCNIMDQSRDQGETGSETKPGAHTASPLGGPLTPDLLAEHLREIRALRQRLEESIRNNDSLREQLEKRLAEVDREPGRTHIFIQEREQLNQASKGQLNSESQDQQSEIDRLRDSVARRTAKLEQSRKECDVLKQENVRMKKRLEILSQENAQLHDSVLCSKEELQRLQCEVRLQSQQLSDSHDLLQSLRVELQVYERLKNQGLKSTEDGKAAQGHEALCALGAVDLGELMSEIKHLRLQLERSIQTNNALRRKLEEQVNHGTNHSETININYLLSSPDEATQGRSTQRRERARNNHDQKQRAVVDGGSGSSSSMESSEAPSRLVPGHRMWASRNGRHVLGLTEDYSALGKHISEGCKLSHTMDAQLQEVLLLFKEQCSEKCEEQKPLRALCSNIDSQQHVLEEANRLLKLMWRVSLPVTVTTQDQGHNQQDELLKREISRLKNRVVQQEKMLNGAVKRLGTTNQLKEGMERVIIDQLSVTHGILKKARGNLETNYCALIGLQGQSGAASEGDPGEQSVDPGAAVGSVSAL
uniref:Centrosomin N-terminal motif 1 domain-containing protein n=1 Tax=Knipowitschia caucasica TaxID=637954 RepID=A0AAV2IRB1_KNICA